MAINRNGVILWEGISKLDGVTPIVAIATGLVDDSDNGKTGALIQTWMLCQDIAPTDARNTGADVGICGDCVHRRDPITGRCTCYVLTYRAPRAIWNCYKAGNYTRCANLSATFAGRAVRLGAYGDPAAVPLAVWAAVLAQSAGHTGYTHAWRYCDPMPDYVQTSCETENDVVNANMKGYGTFLVVPAVSPIPSGAIHCPASAEAGKRTTCSNCQLCDGMSARNVAINAHGSQSSKYLPVVSL